MRGQQYAHFSVLSVSFLNPPFFPPPFSTPFPKFLPPHTPLPPTPSTSIPFPTSHFTCFLYVCPLYHPSLSPHPHPLPRPPLPLPTGLLGAVSERGEGGVITLQWLPSVADFDFFRGCLHTTMHTLLFSHSLHNSHPLCLWSHSHPHQPHQCHHASLTLPHPHKRPNTRPHFPFPTAPFQSTPPANPHLPHPLPPRPPAPLGGGGGSAGRGQGGARRHAGRDGRSHC